MDQAAKETFNHVAGILDKLEQLSEEEQQEVLEGISPEQRQILESVRQQRAMMAAIGEAFSGDGIDTIEFADPEDDEADVDRIDLSTQRYVS